MTKIFHIEEKLTTKRACFLCDKPLGTSELAAYAAGPDRTMVCHKECVEQELEDEKDIEPSDKLWALCNLIMASEDVQFQVANNMVVVIVQDKKFDGAHIVALKLPPNRDPAAVLFNSIIRMIKVISDRHDMLMQLRDNSQNE